jgi:exonuclease SbcD
VSFDEDYEHSVSVVTIGKHGDKPDITTVPVENVMPIWNLPKKAGTLDEAKAAIAAIPAGEKGYARVNIKTKDILPMEQKVEFVMKHCKRA